MVELIEGAAPTRHCKRHGLPLQQTQRINAGVLWTLAYEWKYYAVLPLMAAFARPRYFALLGAVLVAMVATAYTRFEVLHFLFGMLTAYAVRSGRWTEVLSRPRWAWLGLATLAVFFTAPIGPWGRAVLLFGLFLLIAHGNGLFGPLDLPASKYLGTISYGVYLLHGIFLYVGLAFLNRMVPVDRLPPASYWVCAAAIVTTVVCACGVTYRYIEYPFLRPAR